MGETDPVVGDELLQRLFDRCCNWGRWGDDDELGTLNYITAATRLRAAQLVTEGLVVSLAQELSSQQSPTNPRPIVHFTAFEAHNPRAAIDFIGMVPHGLSLTHLDAIAHCYYQDQIYNGRKAVDTQQKASGLAFGSILAQREGIFTRGVLLDVPASQQREWLEAGEYVTKDDLANAELHAGLTVEPGDAVFVHIGLTRRESVQGPEDRSLRAGLDASAVEWLHEKQVSVYSGDCIERTPYPSEMMPVPLHQIGLVAMGLILLDSPRMEGLVEQCQTLNRNEFLLTVAPLLVPGGTGSPVNPIAVF